jgi:hypothetical protein
MVARLMSVFFGKDNFYKVYMEDENILKKSDKTERQLQSFLQGELDRIKIKDRSRDFFEGALVERTSWLQLRPVVGENKSLDKIDFDILSWFDVWFDTKAKKVEESDFIVRKRVKLWELKQNEKHYFNLDLIEKSSPPDDIKERQIYEAENGSTYYDPEKNNVTDEVEIKEWYGWYDVSKNKNKPDFQPVIFTRANDTVLIRIETIEVQTKRKIYIFPIRPLSKRESLISRSVPQITKKLQYLLNEIISLMMDNFRILIKLLFKYKKDGSIDFDELFARGGNCVGYEDDPNDISTFDVPNMISIAIGLISQVIQWMQQITGAVDYVMGTSAGRGITETATGIETITEQAMFKFQMMAENCYGDIKDFLNYFFLMQIMYNKKEIKKRYPDLKKIVDMDIKELEKGYLFDIGMNDLSQRRDVERAQFINAINIIGGLMQNVEGGGNVKELLRQVMSRFDMDNIDKILEPPAEIKKKLEAQQELMQAAAAAANAEAAAQGGETPPGAEAGEQAGGVTPVAPEAPPAPTSNQTAQNPIPGV